MSQTGGACEFFRPCAVCKLALEHMVRIGFRTHTWFYAVSLPGMQSWSPTIKNPQYGTADLEHLPGAVATCAVLQMLFALNMPMLLTGDYFLQNQVKVEIFIQSLRIL